MFESHSKEPHFSLRNRTKSYTICSNSRFYCRKEEVKFICNEINWYNHRRKYPKKNTNKNSSSPVVNTWKKRVTISRRNLSPSEQSSFWFDIALFSPQHLRNQNTTENLPKVQKRFKTKHAASFRRASFFYIPPLCFRRFTYFTVNLWFLNLPPHFFYH